MQPYMMPQAYQAQPAPSQFAQQQQQQQTQSLDDGPRHPLDPEPNLWRTTVKLPRPKYPGGPTFYDTIPQRDATFAWSEICATAEPECSLAPVPQVGQKTWYNSYLYVPEQRSHVERQFLERFVQGENGEWIDVVKARRMSNYLDEQAQNEMRQRQERNAIKSGTIVGETQYTDAYTGEKLVVCHGQLMPIEELWARYNIRPSLLMEMKEQQAEGEGFDFANLRIPWPFGRPDRNKMISKHAYEWFDRRNAYITSDNSYKMMELPSMYVDEDCYYKWAGSAPSNDAVAQIGQAVDRASYFDGYPYRV